jgi:predicted aconitase with swiveling domain
LAQVILELILNGVAPAAILVRDPDMSLALGVSITTRTSHREA